MYGVGGDTAGAFGFWPLEMSSFKKALLGN